MAAHTGAAPVAVATADFNGDGTPDLVTANPTGNSVSVLLGNGDGTFTAAGTPVPVGGSPSGSQPVGVVVGDFNGDGRADVATADFGDHTVTVLLGLGDGRFADPILVPLVASVNPSAIAAGPLQKGGVTDLFVTSSSTDQVFVLLNDGRGNFTVGPAFAVGTDPHAVAVGDLRGNGITDIVTADFSGNDISLLLGDGNGNFVPAPRFQLPVGTSPSDVKLADLGNGHLDIVVADSGSGDVVIYLGDGTGGFLPAGTYPAGLAPESVAVGDFTGNGKTGIAVAGNGSAAGYTVTILPGNGDGTFGPPVYTLGGDGRPRNVGALVAGDFAGYGRADLAVTNTTTNTVSILLGTPGGPPADASGVYSNLFRPSPVVADLNGDGTPDTAVVSQNGAILVRAGIPGTAGPQFLPPDAINTVPARAITVVHTAAGTLLAALPLAGGALTFYNTHGRFTPSAGPAVGAEPSTLLAARLLGTGPDDLVVTDAATGTLSVYVPAGLYPAGPVLPGGYVLASRVSIGTAPVDVVPVPRAAGAGFDLAVIDQLSGQVQLLLNDGHNHFSAALPFRAGTGAVGLVNLGTPPTVRSPDQPTAAVAGAFTAGRPAGLVVLQGGSDRFTLVNGTGAGGFLPPVTQAGWTTQRDPTAVAAGDFLRDGIPDLAVLNRATGTISVYLGDGNGGFTLHGTYPAGADAVGMTLADVSGPDGVADGFPDLVVGNQNGDVLVLAGDGAGGFAAYQGADAAPLSVTPAAGGGTDVLLADRNAGTVSVLTASGTGTATRFKSAGGAIPSVLAPGAVTWAPLTGGAQKNALVVSSGGNQLLVYAPTSAGMTASAPLSTGTDPTAIAFGNLSGHADGGAGRGRGQRGVGRRVDLHWVRPERGVGRHARPPAEGRGRAGRRQRPPGRRPGRHERGGTGPSRCSAASGAGSSTTPTRR